MDICGYPFSLVLDEKLRLHTEQFPKALLLGGRERKWEFVLVIAILGCQLDCI